MFTERKIVKNVFFVFAGSALKIQGHVHDYFTHLSSLLTNIYRFTVEC